MSERPVSIAALLLALVVGSSFARADTPGPDAPPPQGGADAPPTDEAQAGAAEDVYADADPSALTDFRETLDPHGAWADDPSYGTVWVPSPDEIGEDFTPYVSAGHWAYDGDYVWVSDYAWGWVPFHYGRWRRVADRGWVWIPGRAYAGAWVVWRLGSDEYAYVGWAPLPPSWAWRDGMAINIAQPSPAPFVFCPPSAIFAPAPAERVVAGAPAAAIAPHTRPYVHANPVVAGYPLAPRVMRGPSPELLKIDPVHVVRLTSAERSVTRAKAYARPSTALALGAHPPVQSAARPRVVVQSTVRPVDHGARHR